ncbi:MAG TPA: amino acid permease [Beijerinckiaceae bacterium]|nr:amino acid permease [Beijerinckiaceae bacterium]
MPESQRAVPGASLSVLDGVAIMVGIIVGIGIFRFPGLVASNVGSEWAFMGVWLLGGVITLIGALCYAELAAAHPNAGGEYHFLSRAYGRNVALFFAWARGTVIQTGAIALVGFVFGDYANQLIPLGTHGPWIYALLAVATFTGLNLAGTPQSKTAQVVFTFLTLAALFAVVIAALLFARAPATPPPATGGGGGALGLAMVFVLLTYGGWNEAAYLSAEVRDARRNIVRVLLLGTLVVTVLYLLVNFAYLTAFGLHGLRASKAVGADMMRMIAGEAGAVVLSLIVVCAALSTLNATIFTGARVYYALGRDLPIIERLGVWNERGANPVNAILLQGAIAIALVLFGAASRDGVSAMVDYTSPVFWFFMLLVGLSLFVLRFKEPDRELPFRVPLYPVTPILFCATCAYLLYSSLMYTGRGAIVGILVLLSGIPLLLLSRRREKPVAAE